MIKITAAVRYIAPAVLAVGTLLSSATPAFAGASDEERMEKTPLPTPASRKMVASVYGTSARSTHQSSMRSSTQSTHAFTVGRARR